MAMERENRGPRTRKRRKVCQFCADKCDWIDYKDAAKLHRYISERGKITVHHRHLRHAPARADRGNQARPSDCSAAFCDRLNYAVKMRKPDWLPHFLMALRRNTLKSGRTNQSQSRPNERICPAFIGGRTKSSRIRGCFFIFFFLPALQRGPRGQEHRQPGKATHCKSQRPPCCRPCAPAQLCRGSPAPGTGAKCDLCSPPH